MTSTQYQPPAYKVDGDLLVSLDLETTGLDPAFHLPVQLAAVCGPRTYHTLIHWPRVEFQTRCDPEAMKIHGISEGRLRQEGSPIRSVESAFHIWLESVLKEHGARRARLVGWNVGSFDLCFLRNYFRMSMTERISHRCVDLNAIVSIDELRGGPSATKRKMDLQTKAAGLLADETKWHDALWDARAALAALYCLVEGR